MATVTLFKNRFGPVNVSTPKGEVLRFAAGRFFTTNKAHAEYLKELADNGESGVFIDKNEPTVDTENLDPMSAIKAKMRAEIEAEIKSGKVNQAAAVEGGTYDQAPLQNSTQNTMGTAAPAGTPVAAVSKAQEESAKVNGDSGDAAPKAPSKLDELKSGKK